MWTAAVICSCTLVQDGLQGHAGRARRAYQRGAVDHTGRVTIALGWASVRTAGDVMGLPDGCVVGGGPPALGGMSKGCGVVRVVIGEYGVPSTPGHVGVEGL